MRKNNTKTKSKDNGLLCVKIMPKTLKSAHTLYEDKDDDKDDDSDDNELGDLM